MTNIFKIIPRRRCGLYLFPTKILLLALHALLLLSLLRNANSQGEETTRILQSPEKLKDRQHYTLKLKDRRHYTFAVVTKLQDNPFFDPVGVGCQDEALKLTEEFSREDVTHPPEYPQNGATVECLFLGPEDRKSQGQLVKELLLGNSTNQTIDGLAISVNDAESMTKIINWTVQELKIPVITFDSDASQSLRQYYVGTDNSFFGAQLARTMETLKPDGGTYGILSGLAPNLNERVEGIMDELAHQSNSPDSWELLDNEPFLADYEEDTDLTKTFQKMEEWAQLNPAVIVSTHQRPMMIKYDPATNTSTCQWKTFVEKHEHRNITFLCADDEDYQMEFLRSGHVDGLVGQLTHEMGVTVIQTLWTLTFEPDAELGDPEDGDDNATSNQIGTNVVSHMNIPLHLPPLDVDNNLVGNLKLIGYTLYGVVAFTAIGFAAWAFAKRNVRVVRVAQPRFLIMIATGVLIMGSCMIPLGQDDGGGTRADCFDSSLELAEHCTVICMSVPWLAFMGFTITFSALYSKTRRVNKIFRSGSAFGRVQVKEQDVLIPFIILLGANVLILTLWTILDPLIYGRETSYGTDGWNRVISTHGGCSSSNKEYFMIPLGVVNVGVLLLANYQAYQARDIEAEFAETKYIAICMMSMLQAMFTGIPVLFLVWSIPQAFYVVLVLLIFVICMMILITIFVPKVVFALQYMDMSPKEQRQYMTNIISKAANKSKKTTNTGTVSGLHYSGLHYTVPQTVPQKKGEKRMSSLGMHGPSEGGTTTDSTKHGESEESNMNGRPTREDLDSSDSSDTGLIFYRKSCTEAMCNEAAAEATRRASKVKQVSCSERRDADKSNDRAAWTKVHDDVILEGDEETEGHKEEVEPPQPVDDPEQAKEQEQGVGKD